MGVGNSTNEAFYNLTNGKICRAFKSPTDKSVTRENANKKIVHEEFYDYIDGYITDIQYLRENDYGKQWVITLEDDGQMQQLQFRYSSGYSSSFLKTLPNLDFGKKVKLIPKLIIEGDKKKTTLFVNQGDHALKHFYTKDKPNGIPQLEQKKVKGKLIWDDSEIMAFLEAMVENDIRPKLKKRAVAEGAQVAEPAGVEAAEASDDLPF